MRSKIILCVLSFAVISFSQAQTWQSAEVQKDKDGLVGAAGVYEIKGKVFGGSIFSRWGVAPKTEAELRLGTLGKTFYAALLGKYQILKEKEFALSALGGYEYNRTSIINLGGVVSYGVGPVDAYLGVPTRILLYSNRTRYATGLSPGVVFSHEKLRAFLEYTYSFNTVRMDHTTTLGASYAF